MLKEQKSWDTALHSSLFHLLTYCKSSFICGILIFGNNESSGGCKIKKFVNFLTHLWWRYYCVQNARCSKMCQKGHLFAKIYSNKKIPIDSILTMVYGKIMSHNLDGNVCDHTFCYYSNNRSGNWITHVMSVKSVGKIFDVDLSQTVCTCRFFLLH